VGSRLGEVTRMQQGRAHHAMPDHERHYRPLLFSKCQELVAISHIALPLPAT
jgi:hypothetical protein